LSRNIRTTRIASDKEVDSVITTAAQPAVGFESAPVTA
jgi:hypothetical protein